MHSVCDPQLQCCLCKGVLFFTPNVHQYKASSAMSFKQRQVYKVIAHTMCLSLSNWMPCRPFKVEQWTLPRIWEGLIKTSDYIARRKAVEDYNEQNLWRKRGISINPCR